MTKKNNWHDLTPKQQSEIELALEEWLDREEQEQDQEEQDQEEQDQ
jgi:hypothetical protein